MAGAARKSKLTKYLVTLRREVEYHAEVEVEARSAEEAQDTAVNVVDDSPGFWREGDITAMSAKAKVIK